MAKKTHAHRCFRRGHVSFRCHLLFSDCRLAAIAAFLLLLNSGGPALAQDQPATAKGVTDRAITTSDGWQLQATYYSPGTGAETPVVVLLHREGGNRLVWKDGFADKLSAAGYAVIAVDLRKHGESKLIPTRTDSGRPASRRRAARTSRLVPDDYRRMVTEDLEAVKKFIYEEHQKKQLNMNKMAIIAPEMSGAIAIFFTLMDWEKQPYNDAPTKEASTPRGQDVRALVLLSPLSRVRGQQTGPALMKLRRPDWNIAVLTCYGALDDGPTGTADDAHAIHTKLTSIAGNDERMYLKSYPYKSRGTDLLNKPDINVEELIERFLQVHLKEVPGEWRNRKSRLE